MTNKDLLKESLVDAKHLKELAISNAKEQLHEAFGSKIQSLVSKKLREEEEYEMEDDVESTEEEIPMEDENTEEEIPMEDEDTEEEIPMEDEDTEEEMPMEGYTEQEIPMEDEDTEEEIPMEDEEEVTDEELEEVLRELEEMGDEEDDEEIELEEMEHEDEEIELDIEDDEDEEIELEEMEHEDEEIDLEEIFGNVSNNNNKTKKINKLQRENKQLRRALSNVNKTVNEVRLLNTKLLYTNKLFKKYNLKESQKTMVLNTFDRTKTLREVKLVFSSLCESFNSPNVTKKKLRESFASSNIQTTKPNKKPIVNNDSKLAARMKQLANIK